MLRKQLLPSTCFRVEKHFTPKKDRQRHRASIERGYASIVFGVLKKVHVQQAENAPISNSFAHRHWPHPALLPVTSMRSFKVSLSSICMPCQLRERISHEFERKLKPYLAHEGKIWQAGEMKHFKVVKDLDAECIGGGSPARFLLRWKRKGVHFSGVKLC